MYVQKKNRFTSQTCTRANTRARAEQQLVIWTDSGECCRKIDFRLLTRKNTCELCYRYNSKLENAQTSWSLPPPNSVNNEMDLSYSIDLQLHNENIVLRTFVTQTGT